LLVAKRRRKRKPLLAGMIPFNEGRRQRLGGLLKHYYRKVA